MYNRNRSIPFMFIVSLLFPLFIYYSHLYSCGYIALSLFLFSITYPTSCRLIYFRIYHFTLIIMPYSVLLCFYSSIMSHSHSTMHYVMFFKTVYYILEASFVSVILSLIVCRLVETLFHVSNLDLSICYSTIGKSYSSICRLSLYRFIDLSIDWSMVVDLSICRVVVCRMVDLSNCRFVDLSICRFSVEFGRIVELFDLSLTSRSVLSTIFDLIVILSTLAVNNQLILHFSFPVLQLSSFKSLSQISMVNIPLIHIHIGYI